MTRLFLRFYFGVLIVLVAAWLVQNWVYRQSTPAQNVEVVEEALGGGARLARDRLLAAGEEPFAEALSAVQAEFEYPLRVVNRENRSLPESMRQRLDNDEVVLYGSRIGIAFPESPYILEFGPLPSFVGPKQTEISLGVGLVSLMTAVAIAVLLRPVATQLRAVEQTAMAIAEGNLSARIASSPRRRRLQIATAFDAMASRIESLLKSQKELLQAVSHELRTPLARIRFATELLRDSRDEAKRPQRLDAIDHATDQMDELVGELLAYVRLDAEPDSPVLEAVCVEDVISDVLQSHQSLFAGVKFRVDQPDIPCTVLTERRALLRAVSNLISNAGKYARTSVDISWQKADRSIAITIDDDGKGVPVADRELVFEPFQRLAGEQEPGTGLGLALVRRIVRRLGGSIRIDDSPLGGARFVIEVPAEATS